MEEVYKQSGSAAVCDVLSIVSTLAYVLQLIFHFYFCFCERVFVKLRKLQLRCAKAVHLGTNDKLDILFSLLHRAICLVTQFLHQPLHIYKIDKILHIKTLKTLRHVSVLRPSSRSYIFLAKVTLEIVTYSFRCTSWVLWQHAVLCNVMLRRVPCRRLFNVLMCKFYKFYICAVSFLWRCGPTRAMASSFLRFLDHT